MTSTRIIVSFCAALMVALTAGATPARAGDPADDATGIALFNEGRKLAAANDWEHALPKFVEAQRLHPAAAILLNIADCNEHLDRLASAWGAWKQAEIMARSVNDASREHEAAERAAALVPRLAKLAIVVPPATRLPALEVHKDGALVGEGQWGSALPIDVGSHTIEASAPGHDAWSTVVRVETDGASASVEIPALAVPQAQAPPYWNGQRVGGVVLGGAGLVGLVVGAVFGAQTFSKNSASMPYCPTVPTMCSAQGVTLRNDAYSSATVSTVAFIAGGIGLAGGAITFFTATKSAPKSVGLSVTPRSLALQGRW
jgi:hypothetical protein